MRELVKKNIIRTMKFSKLIFVSYLLLFISTFFLGYSIYTTIKGDLSFSLEALKLVNGFDRTIIDDWMNSNKNWSKLIHAALIISALMYLAFTNFISGGLTGSIVNQSKSLQQYLKYGLKNFMPFAGYSILFLLLFLIINGSLVYLFLQSFGHPIDDYETEKPFFYSSILMILFLVSITGFLWFWSMLSRIYYIKENGFFRSMGLGFSSIKKNYFKYLLGFSCFITLTIPAFYVFELIHEKTNASSFMVIIFSLIAMQMTVLYRVFLKSGLLVWLNGDN